MVDVLKTYAQRLKEIRETRGLSVEQLALKTGGLVTAETISKYERGSSMPNSSVVVALALALDVDADYFFGSTTDKKHDCWDVDEELFESLKGKYASKNEETFFQKMQYKQEYECSALNDLLVSEYENADEIYVVRMYNEEYVVGHGVDSNGANEEHVMNLSEALALNLKELGYIDRDLTLWDWLRECDYSVVNYERNYDLKN